LNKVKLSLENQSYNIFVGNSILKELPKKINSNKLERNFFVVVDESVERFHKDYINAVISQLNGRTFVYILKSGENSKSYKELNKIYSALLGNNFGRDSLLIGIGGGVTGDLSGYAAATYMRGIQLIHIPTTLLAAVDSAIGGKTGINFETKKNIVGAFYQPKFVLIDSHFLNSLPEEEFKSGMGEIIKNAFLSGPDLFDYLSKNMTKIFLRDEKVIRKIIIESVKIKASVVSQDEKESGLRKILNLGHTFAHAIETDLNFRIKHGEAVVAGIICALFLSNKVGLLEKNQLDKFLTLPLKINVPDSLKKLNVKRMYEVMKADKKNRGDEIKFVLVTDLGKILIDVSASKKDVFESIGKMQKILFG